MTKREQIDSFWDLIESELYAKFECQLCEYCFGRSQSKLEDRLKILIYQKICTKLQEDIGLVDNRHKYLKYL